MTRSIPPASGGFISRRQVLTVGVSAMTVGLLAACGATATTSITATSTTAARPATSASTASSSAANAKVTATTSATASKAAATSAAAVGGPSTTLTFFAEGAKTYPSYKAWVDGITRFEQANPGYKVDLLNMSYGDIDKKLATGVAAGTPPDISQQDRYTLAGGAARGLMQDISARASRAGINGDDQQPWVWREVSIKGKLYGLPFTTDSRMIFVNVNHLKRTGQPTTAPKTLDDYAQISEHLTIKQGNTFQQLGFAPWVGNWGMYGWGWLFGGHFYDAAKNQATLDDPKNIAALDWLATQAKQLGYADVQAFFKKQNRGNLFTTKQTLSTTLEASVFTPVLMLEGAVPPEPSLDWTVWAPPPPPGAAKMSTWSGGFAVVLPTGAKHPDISFELMRYVSDAKFQLYQAKTALVLPTIKSVAADPFWKTVDPRVKEFVNILPYSHGRPPMPQINILTQQLNKAQDDVLTGKVGARQALQDANKQVNLAIQQNRF